jgi:peroxiredoxin
MVYVLLSIHEVSMADESVESVEEQRTRISRGSLIGFALMAILGAGLAVVISASSELLERGTSAPAFSLPTASGDSQVSLESHRGKIVLIDFWSTTCPPCVRQLADLEQIHQESGNDDVVILGVNTEGAPSDLVARFAQDRGVQYEVLMDTGLVSSQYHVERLPTLYLIDREGMIRWSREGFTSHEQITEVLREHL